VVLGSHIKSVLVLAALLLAGAAHANPLVEKLVGEIEASPSACTEPAATNPNRRQIETLVGEVERKVRGIPAGTRFQVMDCDADGFVYRGRTVVLSDRLVRLNPAQRFFIAAHELGHVELDHHADMQRFVAQLVRGDVDESSALALVQANYSGISREHEVEADAFAVRAMLQGGYDPEQAARLFDSIDDDQGNATHPSAVARAQAIRRVAAALRQQARQPAPTVQEAAARPVAPAAGTATSAATAGTAP
jgi:Zn-dependent protease with chaperone function